jgi:hypothetical protein
MEHSKLPWFIDYMTSVETNIKNDERLDICMCAGNDEDAAGSDNAEFIVEACNNYERLQAENKAWETNYNNLTAQFEEVSAIAQKQEVKITNRENVLSYVKTVLVDARNYVADRALSIEDDIDEAISTIEELLGGS